ncbi:MAG: DUF4214 domain-containing protein [Actinomycetota bacterium]
MSVDPQSHQPDSDGPEPRQTGDAAPVGRLRVAVLAAVVSFGIATLAGLLGPSPASGVDEAADAETADQLAGQVASTGVPDIMFPVVGPSAFTDTWGACRGVGCSRRHKGVDIFGVKLQPLVAAEDGVITGVRRSGLGISGNTIVLESDAGWRYLYIHVNNDSPGTDDGANPQGWITANRLRVGDRVSAGDVIGYLGDSGNAEDTPNHVHFEIHQPGVGAINPTPAVLAAREAGRVVTVASLASTVEGRAEYAPTVVAWYEALLKRPPTDKELFAWTDRFDIGFANLNDLIADLTMAPERRNVAGPIIRSFDVVLDRSPSLNEIRLWGDAIRTGTTVDALNKALLDSGAFRDRHGELTDEQFIRVMYQLGGGTDPTEEQLVGWLELLADGASRTEVAVHWVDSYTVKDRTWHKVEVIQAFRAGLDRMPTPDEEARWVGHLDAGGLVPDVVEAIRSERTAAQQATADDGGDSTDTEAGETTDPTEDDGEATAEDEPATADAAASTDTEADSGDGAGGESTAVSKSEETAADQ